MRWAFPLGEVEIRFGGSLAMGRDGGRVASPDLSRPDRLLLDQVERRPARRQLDATGRVRSRAVGVGPPSGTVTFLFTDIEGSTRRWEADPDAMRAALVVHDE